MNLRHGLRSALMAQYGAWRPRFCLSRCRSQTQVLLGVLASLFALNGILLIGLHFAPRSVPIPTRYRWDEFEDVGGRIGDLERTIASDDALDGGKIGWIIGTSSTRAGFSSTVLEAEDGMNIRWLVLGGGGLDFADLQYLISPLRLMQRKPDVVILATHRSLLVNFLWRSSAEFAPQTSLWRAIPTVYYSLLNELMERWQGSRHESPPLPTSIADALAPLREFLGSNNAYLTLSMVARLYLRHAFYGFRFHLFDLFRQDSTGLFPSKNYRTELSSNANFIIAPKDRVVANFFLDPLKTYRDQGCLDPESYRPEEYGARTFSDFLQHLSEFGAPLYVVLMPERSEIHGAFPIEADALLDSIVAQCESGFPIGRLDTTTLMEDSWFRYDTVHLARPEGQELFSRRFARIIGGELRGRFLWPDDGTLTARAGSGSRRAHN